VSVFPISSCAAGVLICAAPVLGSTMHNQGKMDTHIKKFTLTCVLPRLDLRSEYIVGVTTLSNQITSAGFRSGWSSKKVLAAVPPSNTQWGDEGIGRHGRRLTGHIRMES
jgi:hypothetical protein